MKTITLPFLEYDEELKTKHIEGFSLAYSRMSRILKHVKTNPDEAVFMLTSDLCDDKNALDFFIKELGLTDTAKKVYGG